MMRHIIVAMFAIHDRSKLCPIFGWTEPDS